MVLGNSKKTNPLFVRKYVDDFQILPYLEDAIANGKKKGLWRVLGIKDCVLVRANVIQKLDPGQINDLQDLIIDLGSTNPLYVLNNRRYGQVINTFSPDFQSQCHEIRRTFENHDIWQRRYISPEIIRSLAKFVPDDEPNPDKFARFPVKSTECADVFEVPLFTEKFCDELLSFVKVIQSIC